MILVCFLGLCLIRLTGFPGTVHTLLLVAIIAGLSDSGFGWPWYHLITFFGTSAIVTIVSEPRRPIAFISLGAACLILATWSVAFAYTGVSLLMVGTALKAPALPQCLTRISDYCYEYYLVHGVALVFATSVFRNSPATAVAIGVAIAVIAAIVLKRLTEQVVDWWVPGSPPEAKSEDRSDKQTPVFT